MHEFPLKGSQYTIFKIDEFMDTEIAISKDGNLEGTTKTWTYSNTRGFVGSVIVHFTNSLNEILYTTPPQRYTVYSEAYTRQLSQEDPNVISNRIDIWSDKIPEDILKQLSNYAIIHSSIESSPQKIEYFFTPFNEGGRYDRRGSNQGSVKKN
ncbi:hypothetical protein [Bacillus cereus group sp. MYBK57-1]|uniref:hypothetical protein n=1 Tax=Bacillus cereus group sp. MYBK57-1 TaxID=3450619 RepID=UPI003F7A34A2